MSTMRVVAIGYDPGVAGVEAAEFGSAGSLGACDAVIWSPAGLFDEYRDAYTGPGNETGESLLSLAASTRLLADSRRRRADFESLLGRGGVLVVNPCGSRQLRVHAIEDIVAFDPEEILPRGLRPGMVPMDETGSVEFRGGQPFRAFADAAGVPGWAGTALESFRGVPLFFGVRTGAILGGYVYHHPGHLLFLPRPDPEDRVASRRWHGALLPLLATFERQGPGFALPSWSEAYPVSGEVEVRRTLRTLLAERERLARDIDDARERLGEVARRKALFAGQGNALITAAAHAFESSGALVLVDLLGPGSLVLEHRGRFAVVLVADRAGEVDAVERLHALLHAFRQSFGGTAGGIVVHGRGVPPDRGAPASAELQRSLERDGHCYVTGWDLFGLLSPPFDPEEVLGGLFTAKDPSDSNPKSW